MDPDQARQNVGPDLDSSCLTLMVFPIEKFWKDDFENNQQTKKGMKNYPACKELTLISCGGSNMCNIVCGTIATMQLAI